MVPAQDLRVGGRQSDSQYQFTLWSADIDALQALVPKVLDRVKLVPGVVDVTTDREQGGLQANIVIDRTAAASKVGSVLPAPVAATTIPSAPAATAASSSVPAKRSLRRSARVNTLPMPPVGTACPSTRISRGKI